MSAVIRQAILDRETMDRLSMRDLEQGLRGAVSELSPSDVRGFIYRCMSNRDLGKGFAMADSAIGFALDMKAAGKLEVYKETMGAAVGTLSLLSGSNPAVKEKLMALLGHADAEVVIAVIDSLGHTSNLDNFHRVSELLLHEDGRICCAAARYVESCARDAAFRKRSDLYVIEDEAEEFLRKALLRLESVYKKIRETGADDAAEIGSRIAILVAMMYNEILDSMDWRRTKQEEVDERIYYALEQYLTEQLGNEATPHIEGLLLTESVESGIKRSALHTLSRLAKQEVHRGRVTDFLPKFVEFESDTMLISLARSIETALLEGREFSVLSYIPDSAGRLSSIVPRAAGAPLKRPAPPKLEDL